MKTIVIEDKQRIESIILQADACFVGITDLEGNPYVVPMNFGYENDTLYLHSGPEGGKIEMLQHNNNVCITFQPRTQTCLSAQAGSLQLQYALGERNVPWESRIHRRYGGKAPCTGHYHAPLHERISSAIPILPYGMSKYGKYL